MLCLSKLNSKLTTSAGLGVPGLSVLNDLAITSENDPDLLRAVIRTGTFSRLDIGTDAMTLKLLLLELNKFSQSLDYIRERERAEIGWKTLM